MTFKEFMAMQEMWFTDSKVQKNRRKPNKNLEGTQLPRSMAPQPAAQAGGMNAYPSGQMKKG